MTKFHVAFYEDRFDEQIGPSVDLPYLPYPGLVILYEGHALSVERVQVGVPQRGSIADINGTPPLVDVMVTYTHGVHHER